MGITINGKNYADATSKGNNSVWDAGEGGEVTKTADAPYANYDLISMESLAQLMNLANFETGSWSLQELLARAGDVPDTFSGDAQSLGEQIEAATKKLEALDNAKTELTDKLAIVEQQLKSGKSAKTEADLTPQEKKELTEQQTLLKSALAHTDAVLSTLLAKLQESVAQAEDENEALKNKDSKFNSTTKDAQGTDVTLSKKLSEIWQALKQRLGVVDSKLQESAASKPGVKAATGGTGETDGDGGDAPRGGGSRGAVGGGPFGQARGAGGPLGFPPFDMNALLMSNYMQQNQLEGMDTMHKTENESKRMMLLFFMLARMAMSGDVGAMYQFLRFIGHIVNKDKAMQNVQLARKLIELQDVSRKLTQMLVDQPAHDEEDQSVQAEYMKLQQKVQAEQGVIATSQKLIAQMLEEFTQVSEMMTGMTKSLLDARGRELSMLAVWRA